MMEQFMNQQKQAMDEMKETIKQQSTQIKMLENQVANKHHHLQGNPALFRAIPNSI
jgi:flagellar biosynthesis chaperone FliJ